MNIIIRDEVFYFNFVLNQFFGFKYDLYLLNISFPTRIPPVQNVISAITRVIVLTVIFVFMEIVRKGINGRNKNRIIDRITRESPVLNFQFLFCILNA